MSETLLSPVTLGSIELANRVVMAPMTRSRATAEGDVTDLMVEYYQQRASAGLIISEGIYPSENGKGYCRTPGLVTAAQVAGWKRVTDAVHDRGGQIVAQIMHCGRVTHTDNQAAGAETVAPSAITATGDMFTDTAGLQPFSEPRALRLDEIPSVVAEFGAATERAFAAGFDGVELHGTSGYLPAQFLSTGTNHRTDEYGGSVANRIRFIVEVLDAMVAVDGPGRVGMRICPNNPYNDLHDDDPVETFSTLLSSVADLSLAYLHVIRLYDTPDGPAIDNFDLARRNVDWPLVLNDGFEPDTAEAMLGSGSGAAVSFGRHFISNPDLVERIAAGAPLEPFNHKVLYTRGADGYTTYPTMDG